MYIETEPLLFSEVLKLLMVSTTGNFEMLPETEVLKHKNISKLLINVSFHILVGTLFSQIFRPDKESADVIDSDTVELSAI